MVGLCVRGLRCAHGLRRPNDEGLTIQRPITPVRGSVRGSRGRRAPLESLESRVLMAAAPVPAGAEFRVNTQTTGEQQLFAESPHAVAADADGDFVVAWSSSGQDGSGWGVYAQRYAADGTPRGGEFRVNQVTAADQWYAGVACDAAGNFIVTWTSAGQDGNGDGVYARRYTATGAPLGDEFRVNSTTANHQRHASVAMASGGAFVVAWSGLSQPEGATSVTSDVYAQRYDAAGVKQGGEFRVNTTLAGDQQFASVAADNTGHFIVTWTTDAQDGSGTGVYARRYSAAGAAQGGEFRVNTYTAGNQHYSRVAADSDGDFVVTWASAAQDGSGRGVYAQRYSPTGVKKGSEFRVNEVTAGEQFAPTVAADDGGGFVVTWTGAQDGDLFGVFARAYDSAGAGRGGEFRVNTQVAGNQVYGAGAAAGNGRLVVVWQSDKQDGSFFGVYGQRYAAPDSIAPTANITDVAPDPRNTAVATVTIAFTEAITGVDRTDFTLTRNGGADLLTDAQTLTPSGSGILWTLSGLSSLTAADGTYVLTLKPAGTGITDAAGNGLSGGATDQWVVETVRPTADVVDVAPDPRTDAVPAVTIQFSEPVTGLDLTDLRLTRDGGANLLTAAQSLTVSDGGATWTVGNLAGLTSASGSYSLRLVTAGSGVVDRAGNAPAADVSDAWTTIALPPAARVVGRHVFYNGSGFDGRDGAANAGDDLAVATDKVALLPGGGAAGFANYTSYPRGLNGIMVDIAGLSAGGGAPESAPLLTAADFGFRVGNVASVSQWQPAPAPASIGVRLGAGVEGSDRVTVTWADGSVARGWLQVTTLATPLTRLAAADVFYFGNLPGETGNVVSAAEVDGSDVLRTRAAIPGAAATVDSRFDHNRDGRVDAKDLAVVRGAVGGGPLQLIGSQVSLAAGTPSRRAYRPPGVTEVLDLI